jgi:sortase (surface protein transpeptidase)
MKKQSNNNFTEYFTAPSAPESARVLTLSTCTNDGNKNARLLVHAARAD